MIRSSLIFALGALALVTLAFTAPASATRVLGQPEGAYEVLLSDVVTPTSNAGYLVFKPCGSCDRTSMNVTASTTYFVRQTPVSREEFVRVAQERRAQSVEDPAALFIYYDVETKRINRLVLNYVAE